MIARRARAAAVALVVVALGVATPAFADQVVADDLVVQGNTCVGFDCINGEAFGSDTIRLKENNTRIGFADTSATVGQPDLDWEFTANDSSSGGADRLSILQPVSGAVTLSVLGASPTDTLQLRATGSVANANGAFLLRIDGTSTTAGAALGGASASSRLATVPTGTWRFTDSGSQTRHVGPRAAEFNAAFGVGSGSDLATSDVVGVALAVLQDVDARIRATTTGAAGDAGATGDRGPAGAPGTPGLPGTDGRDGVTAVGADEALRRRIARLSAQQSNLALRTTVLTVRASAVRRGIARLPR